MQTLNEFDTMHFDINIESRHFIEALEEINRTNREKLERMYRILTYANFPYYRNAIERIKKEIQVNQKAIDQRKSVLETFHINQLL